MSKRYTREEIVDIANYMEGNEEDMAATVIRELLDDRERLLFLTQNTVRRLTRAQRGGCYTSVAMIIKDSQKEIKKVMGDE